MKQRSFLIAIIFVLVVGGLWWEMGRPQLAVQASDAPPATTQLNSRHIITGHSQGTMPKESMYGKKVDEQPVNTYDILARMETLPVSTWRYGTEKPPMVHIGALNEDFYLQIGVGGHGKIPAQDIAGVNLAAIVALVSENKTLKQQVAQLENENNSLEQQVGQLKSEQTTMKSDLEAVQKSVQELKAGLGGSLSPMTIAALVAFLLILLIIGIMTMFIILR